MVKTGTWVFPSEPGSFIPKRIPYHQPAEDSNGGL